MSDSKPNPVPGDAAAAEAEDQRGAGGETGAGQSGGGAYPNPHAAGGEPTGGFMGHGGQTDIAYRGPGQLGDEEVGRQENPNGVTRDD